MPVRLFPRDVENHDHGSGVDKDDVRFAFQFAGYVLLLLLVPVGLWVFVRLSDTQIMILVVSGYALLLIGAVLFVRMIGKELEESRIRQTKDLVFNEERRVLSCPDGREFPFDRLRIDIHRIVGERETYRTTPSVYWVYVWVGSNFFYLESFTDLTEARSYARGVWKKLQV